MPKEYFLKNSPTEREEDLMVENLIKEKGGTITILPKSFVHANWKRFMMIPNVFIVGLPNKYI